MKFQELQAVIQGMTRKQANAIADSAGVGKTTIAHIRKGRTGNPRIETVERLIAALKANKPATPRRAPSPQPQSTEPTAAPLEA